MEYRAKIGARINDIDAQEFGEYLRDWIDQNGGLNSLEQFQKLEQEAKKTPLGRKLIWDDKKAATKYRIHQLRMLVGSIECKLVFDGEDHWTRAFRPTSTPVHFSYDNVEEEPELVFIAAYHNIEDILADPHMRKDALRRALERFRWYRGAYGHLKELTAIFDAIDAIEV